MYESGDLAAPVAAASLRLPSVNHAFGTMVSLAILERAAPAVATLWRSAGLEPAPYAGAFEGLYVDVVPPCFDGEQPLCESVRLRLVGGEAVRPAALARASFRSRSSTRPWARSSTSLPSFAPLARRA